MKFLLKAGGALFALGLLASASLLLAAWWFGTPFDDGTLWIDDTGYRFGDYVNMHALDIGEIVVAFIGIAIACVVVMVVVPVAVSLPVAFGVLVAAGVLVAVVFGFAIALSPLLLLGWVIWKLAKRPATVAG